MKLKKLSKKALASVAVILSLGATATPALAGQKTVYYKGTKVYWEYGNRGKVYAYSKVQTHHYTHLATANGKSSGWKKKGKLASAGKWITPGTKAYAYWDCKG